MNHNIYDMPDSPKTMSSYILLKEYYRDLDVSFNYDNDWRYYFIVRRHFLRKKKKENGGLWFCHYCGKTMTKIQKRKNRKQQKDCVTVDHKVPVSDPKCDKLDTTNMVECCTTCNNKKGTKDYHAFMMEMSENLFDKPLTITL